MLVAPTSVSFHSPKWVFSPKYHFTLLPYSKEVLSVAFCCVCVGRVSRARGEYYQLVIVRSLSTHTMSPLEARKRCGGQVWVPITEVLTLP